jgi:hypothetical protein
MRARTSAAKTVLWFRDIQRGPRRLRESLGIKDMGTIEYSDADREGLARALNVARSGVRSPVSDGDEKLLGFFLRDGMCDAKIGVPVIEVRFSWLQKRNPSIYFGSLAPGLITQLMDLGGLNAVADSVEFTVGPGITGTERYRFSFLKKWVLIQCHDESILIRVRDHQRDLRSPLHEQETDGKCPYCGKSLPTSHALQCFSCGMDWHDRKNPVRRGEQN